MPLNVRGTQVDLSEKHVLVNLTSDVLALRAAFVALTAKLDLDGGVTGTDFASLTNPPASNVVL